MRFWVEVLGRLKSAVDFLRVRGWMGLIGVERATRLHVVLDYQRDRLRL
jgi:hypothetical protein